LGFLIGAFFENRAAIAQRQGISVAAVGLPKTSMLPIT
jgi:hypothetical protein